MVFSSCEEMSVSFYSIGTRRRKSPACTHGAVDSPSSMTHGAPTVSEQMRPVALTPLPQQASPPVKPSGEGLLLQPLPAQDPQLSAQQTVFC